MLRCGPVLWTEKRNEEKKNYRAELMMKHFLPNNTTASLRFDSFAISGEKNLSRILSICWEKAAAFVNTIEATTLVTEQKKDGLYLLSFNPLTGSLCPTRIGPRYYRSGFC